MDDKCYVCGLDRETEPLIHAGANTWRHDRCHPGSARWLKYKPDHELNKHYNGGNPMDKRLEVLEGKIDQVLEAVSHPVHHNPVPAKSIVQLMPVIQHMRDRILKGGKNVSKKKRKRLDDRPLPGERTAQALSV